MTAIHSEFAERAGMKFGIHKCAYLGREFVGGRGEDVPLKNFNMCEKTIPELEGSETFKYLDEHKAPASAKTH